ncbi:hypothetical protein B0J11DRAFT_32649 [Dendryphion nanum]|uniref:Uncharacterized protein n=1 Tax=Dendryphion nanum TaxID=256645 RepID=A0A9P9EGA1_9PLEO|nr:hypothetical protein B0J11DRAFT_32649 [Dendryphion nanum]
MGLCTITLMYTIIFLLFNAIVLVTAIDCAPASTSFTIKTAQDVADINTCPIFTGNIVVAADGPGEIALNGIQNITGNLDIENVAQLRSLSSNTIQSISSFTLNNLPRLSNLNFPTLNGFNSIKWYNLPQLEQCTVATGTLQGDVQEITIFNTAIKSLGWIKWPIGSQMNISSNARLTTVAIPYSKINTGSALTISNNTALESVDLSEITGIYGGLAILGNENITSVLFAKLQTINGFVQLNGDFKNVSMPALTTISGALSVKSTANISPLCTDLQNKNLQGHYDCTANVAKNSVSKTETTLTTSVAVPTSQPQVASQEPARSNSLPTGAKVGIAIGVIVVVVLGLTGAFFFFRRRMRSSVQEISKPETGEMDSSNPPVEAYTSNTAFPKELESRAARLELSIGRQRQELPSVIPAELDAWHGSSELKTPITPVSPSASCGSLSARSDAPLVRHELPA